MKVDIDLRPLWKLVKKISTFPENLSKNFDGFQAEMDRRLLEAVIRHASGRPGPNIVTGRYVSSFMLIDHKVVNPSPQTHRLEYGFIGQDSLGRVYAQPPYPHFRPALEEMRKPYRDGIVHLIGRTWQET